MRTIPEHKLQPEPPPSKLQQLRDDFNTRKPSPQVNPLDAILKNVVELSAINQKTQGQIAQYGEVVARCVEELSKPKVKKKWGCIVSRDTAGQIKNIDFEEK